MLSTERSRIIVHRVHRADRCGSTLFVLFSVLLLLAGGVGLGVWKLGPQKAEGPSVITHTVQRGVFENDVVERGEVESSSNVEVRCEVQSRGTVGMTILEVVDEGTQVEKGDLLVQLDASALDRELVEQQVQCNTIQAAMIEAKNNYEAAEIAEDEYIKGTYIQEEEQILSEIFIAEENLRRSKEYLSYSQRLAARGYVTSQQLEGDQFAVEKAKTELKVAKVRLNVLQEYTKQKMLKTLQSTIKSTEASWKSQESTYKLELEELAEMEDEIKKCEIRAPEAGQVVYANRQSSRRESEFIVEAGSTVRENQVMIRLPDPTKMQVKAKVNESQVTSISSGMPASIRLDAFGDSLLNGEVTRVNEYPEPSGWYSSQVKEYATFIAILTPPPTLRPGLTAEVTIHVQRTENALMLPVQAVYEHGRDLYAIRKMGDDQWEAAMLDAGSTNQRFIYIKSGVQEGDVVAMNPRKLLDLVDLPEIVEDKTDASRRASSSAPKKKSLKPTGGAKPAASGSSSAGGAGGTANAETIVTAISTKLDKNNDSKLTNDEIPADQAERMKPSDANQDGIIDKAEMMKAIKSRMAKASAGGGSAAAAPGSGS